MNRSIPDPFQLSRKGSRSIQDPKKVECDPDLELLRSVPDHVCVLEFLLLSYSIKVVDQNVEKFSADIDTLDLWILLVVKYF